MLVGASLSSFYLTALDPAAPILTQQQPIQLSVRHLPSRFLPFPRTCNESVRVTVLQQTSKVPEKVLTAFREHVKIKGPPISSKFDETLAFLYIHMQATPY